MDLDIILYAVFIGAFFVIAAIGVILVNVPKGK